MSIVFVGKEGVDTYRAITLKHALALYAKCKVQVNRAYTPTRMLRAAGSITGQTFKRGQYAQAIAALDAWILANGTTGQEG